MQNFFRRHAGAWTAIGVAILFLVGTVPAWLGSVWPVFVSDQTIPEWLVKHGWSWVITPPYVFIFVGAAVLTLLACAFLLQRRPTVGATPVAEADGEGPPVGLEIAVTAKALSGGAPIGNGRRETSFSLQIRVLNSDPQRRYSLHFALAKSPDDKYLFAATQFDCNLRGVATISGWRQLFSPLAVGTQEEITGHLFFFSPLAPKDLPCKYLVIQDSLTRRKWAMDLGPLPEGARDMSHYTVDVPHRGATET